MDRLTFICLISLPTYLILSISNFFLTMFLFTHDYGSAVLVSGYCVAVSTKGQRFLLLSVRRCSFVFLFCWVCIINNCWCWLLLLITGCGDFPWSVVLLLMTTLINNADGGLFIGKVHEFHNKRCTVNQGVTNKCTVSLVYLLHLSFTVISLFCWFDASRWFLLFLHDDFEVQN